MEEMARKSKPGVLRGEKEGGPTRPVGRPTEASRTHGDITQRAFFHSYISKEAPSDGEGVPDEHWMWTKPGVSAGTWSPTTKFDGKMRSVRKILFEHYRPGDAVHNRLDVVLPTAECGRRLCMNPFHAKVYNRSEAQQFMWSYLLEDADARVASSGSVVSGSGAATSGDATKLQRVVDGFVTRAGFGDAWTADRWEDFPRLMGVADEAEELYDEWTEEGSPNTREVPLRKWAETRLRG